MNDLDMNIAEIDKKLKDPSKIKLAKQEFFKLLQTATQYLKFGSFAEKDTVAQKLFSNLALDEKITSPSLLNQSLKG